MTVIAVTFDTVPQTGSAAGSKLNLIWDTTLGSGGWREVDVTSSFEVTKFYQLTDTPTLAEMQASPGYTVQVSDTLSKLDFVPDVDINGGVYGQS